MYSVHNIYKLSELPLYVRVYIKHIIYKYVCSKDLLGCHNKIVSFPFIRTYFVIYASNWCANDFLINFQENFLCGCCLID